MVQISVGGGGELEGTEADVVQGLVVDAVGLVGVLDELVDGEGGVVGLDDGVGHLGVKNVILGNLTFYDLILKTRASTVDFRVKFQFYSRTVKLYRQICLGQFSK